MWVTREHVLSFPHICHLPVAVGMPFGPRFLFRANDRFGFLLTLFAPPLEWSGSQTFKIEFFIPIEQRHRSVQPDPNEDLVFGFGQRFVIAGNLVILLPMAALCI